MLRVRVVLLLALAISLSTIANAQGRLPADLAPNGGLKVECWTGTAFGACSSGGAGTDVNIAAVGGTPVGGANVPVNCVVGCAGSTTDTDDGSIATGQVTGIPISLSYVYNGATWGRLTFGQTTMANSLSVAIASNQGAIPVSGTVDPTSPSAILNGNTNVTTAGTRVTLAASTTVKGVTVCAKTTNTGNIFMGNATVSSANGRILRPGECQSIAIANLNTVNLDSAVNGEGVTYIGVN